MMENQIKKLFNKKVIDNLDKFYNSREVINFFRDYIEILSDADFDAKQN